MSSPTNPPPANPTPRAPDPNVISQIQENLPEFELPEMFSTRRPKNLLAGLSSGIKSLLKGTVSGVVGLVAAPTVGAKDGGFQGFCVGLANGLASAIALPVTGAAVATLQISRGAMNSVESVIESANGKDWDQEKREWYSYDLNVDAAKVLSLDENEEEGTARSSDGRSVANAVANTGRHCVRGGGLRCGVGGLGDECGEWRRGLRAAEPS